MGYRRGVALKSLVAVLFFEYLSFETHLLNIFGHVLEENSDRRLALVVDPFQSHKDVFFLQN